MTPTSATAIAHPNIAFVKYWGNRDHELRLPANGSISLTLGGLETRTTVQFDSTLDSDHCWINGQEVNEEALARVSKHLGRIRKRAGLETHALVRSRSNFPLAAGIASSASGFAALTVAGSLAAGLDLNARQLSRLARCGSGSAARSIFGGYVQWHRGQDDSTSFAEPIAPADHWPLTDLIVIVDDQHKEVGSRHGHQLAESSPLQAARIDSAPERLAACRQAVLGREFDRLARVAELDSDMMHAVMMTSQPALFYWGPGTLAIMQHVRDLRQHGLPVFYTVDAGPNVHCITPTTRAGEIRSALATIPGVLQILDATPGGPTRAASEAVAG